MTRKIVLKRIFGLLLMIILGFGSVQLVYSLPSSPLPVHKDPFVNNTTIYFLEDFNHGDLSNWELFDNTGEFDYYIQEGIFITKSTREGRFQIAHKNNFTDLNVLVDGTLFYGISHQLNTVSLRIIFYSSIHNELGSIRYHLCYNDMWNDDDFKKNFMIHRASDAFYRISDGVGESDRNLTYCLDNYLLGINSSNIEYYKVHLYSYAYFYSELTSIFDDIILYTESNESQFLELSNFSDFVLDFDDPYIESINSNNTIDYSYNGSSSALDLIEKYSFDLTGLGSGGDFYVQLNVSYNFSSLEDVGIFGLNLTSYFDSNYGYQLTDFASLFLNDELENQTGHVVLMGYNNGNSDIFKTAQNTSGLTGDLAFIVKRIGTTFSLSAINTSNNNLIINYTWQNCIHNPLYKITLFFSSGRNQTNLQVAMTSFYSFIESVIFIQKNLHNDANSGNDARDDWLNALIITKPGNFTGGFYDLDYYDYYIFYVYENYKISITLSSGIKNNFNIHLYDHRYMLAASGINSSNLKVIDYEPTLQGVWYLVIEREVGKGKYYFTLDVTPSTYISYQNDGNSGMDAGSTFETAVTIPIGVSYGSFPVGDYYDFYKISLEKGKVKIVLDGPLYSIFFLTLYDNNCIFVDENSTSSSRKLILHTIENEGYWFILVSRYDGIGYYTLIISFETIPPTSPQNFDNIIIVGIIVGSSLISFLIVLDILRKTRAKG